MKKGQLKVVENQVLWWNGEKWLVKETCEDNAAALTLLEQNG